MRRNAKNESGIALIMVLGVLAVLLILAVTFAFNMRLEQRAARNYLDYVSADYFAKAGIERAIAELLEQAESFNYYNDDVIWSGGNSGWVDVEAGGITIGRFRMELFDESGRLNLNHTGNLSDNGASPSHGANEGWTTYEISIEDFLVELFFPVMDQIAAEELAGAIINYRYGGQDDAGDNDYIFDINADGIDNDGSGNVGNSSDPFWFTPWKPRLAGYNYQPFITATQLYMVYEALYEPGHGADWKELFWDEDWPPPGGLKNRVTAHSRSGNTFFDGANLRNMLNINAVYSAQALYEHLSPEFAAGQRDDLAQACVNIMDYRDTNHHLSSITAAQTFYGTESVLINQVLANSYRDAAGLNYENVVIGTSGEDGESSPFNLHEDIVGGISDATAFRLRIYYTVNGSLQNPDPDYAIKVWGDSEGVDWGVQGSVAGSFDVDYIPLSDSMSSDDGELFIRTSIVPDPLDPDPISITITRVVLVCAEFVELVNIGNGLVLLDNWDIVIEPNIAGIRSESSMPSASIGEGDYLILTNDLDLFEVSYGVGLNVFQIDDWEAGYTSEGEFRNDGEFDILIYDADGNLAELAVAPLEANNSLDFDVANVSRPGNSGAIGVSRIRDNAPWDRTSWDNQNPASPGSSNPDWEDLIRNKHFASIGELVETEDWLNPGQIKYPGVRFGDSELGANFSGFLEGAANRLIAGYYIRLDESEAENTSPYEWQEARLDSDHRRMEYRLYAVLEDGYGLSVSGDVLVGGSNVMSFSGISYSENDTAFLGSFDTVEADGMFRVNFTGDFDYLLLVPSSIPGRINVNTASADVLAGLPGAPSLGGTYDSMGAVVSALTPAEFAPIANLITVDSDVFRIRSTGTSLGPQGEPSATKTIEAIVDRSGGRIRILSWKVLD